jgi:hypothetical protein
MIEDRKKLVSKDSNKFLMHKWLGSNFLKPTNLCLQTSWKLVLRSRTNRKFATWRNWAATLIFKRKVLKNATHIEYVVCCLLVAGAARILLAGACVFLRSTSRAGASCWVSQVRWLSETLRCSRFVRSLPAHCSCSAPLSQQLYLQQQQTGGKGGEGLSGLRLLPLLPSFAESLFAAANRPEKRWSACDTLPSNTHVTM